MILNVKDKEQSKKMKSDHMYHFSINRYQCVISDTELWLLSASCFDTANAISQIYLRRKQLLLHSTPALIDRL